VFHVGQQGVLLLLAQVGVHRFDRLLEGGELVWYEIDQVRPGVRCDGGLERLVAFGPGEDLDLDLDAWAGLGEPGDQIRPQLLVTGFVADGRIHPDPDRPLGGVSAVSGAAGQGDQRGQAQHHRP
jgi:hypothetical protein